MADRIPFGFAPPMTTDPWSADFAQNLSPEDLARLTGMAGAPTRLDEWHARGDSLMAAADRLKNALAPSYMRDIPSSPQADAALADPNRRPGKIGPYSGPPTGANIMAGMAGDAASFAAPEISGLMNMFSTPANAADAPPLSEADKFEAGYRTRKADFLRSMRKQGVDPDSKRGLAQMQAFEERENPGRQAAIAADREASLRRAQLDADRSADADWLRQNETAINKLPKEQQDQIRGAGSLAQRQDLFKRYGDEYIQSNQTFGERFPPAMHAIQGLTPLAAIYGGAKLAGGRANTLAKAADEAYDAYRAAHGIAGNATPGALNELAAKRNILQRYTGLRTYDPREIAIGTALPWGFGTAIPAAYDIAESQPGDERRRKAIDSINPLSTTGQINAARGGLEGLVGTLGGQFFGGWRRDMGPTQARARALLDTIDRSGEPPVLPPSGPPPAAPPTISPLPPPLMLGDVPHVMGPSMVPGGQKGAGRMPEPLPGRGRYYEETSRELTPEFIAKLRARGIDPAMGRKLP